MTDDRELDALDAMEYAELKERVCRKRQPLIGDGGDRKVGQFAGVTLVNVDSRLGGFSVRRYAA